MTLQKGFTLIEVMIVVAIIGIIAAIAYPSYQQYVLRSWRTQGQGCLLELAQIMERRYTASANMQYSALPETAGAITGFCAMGNGLNNRYRFTQAVNGAAGTFTLTATPAGAQASDTDCAAMTVNQLGQKGAAGTLGAAGCW